MKDSTRASIYLGLSCIPALVGLMTAFLFLSFQFPLLVLGSVTTLLFIRFNPRAWHYITNYNRATLQYSEEFNKNYRYEPEGSA